MYMVNRARTVVKTEGSALNFWVNQRGQSKSGGWQNQIAERGGLNPNPHQIEHWRWDSCSLIRLQSQVNKSTQKEKIINNSGHQEDFTGHQRNQTTRQPLVYNNWFVRIVSYIITRLHSPQKPVKLISKDLRFKDKWLTSKIFYYRRTHNQADDPIIIIILTSTINHGPNEWLLPNSIR